MGIMSEKVNVLKEQRELAIKGFPNEYRDTISYKQSSKEDIQHKIAAAVSSLISSGDEQVIIYSGNTMILVKEVHEEDGGGYHIVVSENYKEMYIGNKDLR